MAIFHCDLALGTGDDDGTSWANAYQGAAGLVTGAAAASAGDTIYVKNTISETTTRNIVAPNTLAVLVNPVRIVGVKAATTNEDTSIVQSDLIPGLRTGDSTRAYAQTAGNAPPSISITGGVGDFGIAGGIYVYGLIGGSNDDLTITATVKNNIILEECKFSVDGSGDRIFYGNTGGSTTQKVLTARNCLFDAGAGTHQFFAGVNGDFFGCAFDCTTVGSITGARVEGVLRFFGCDLSGMSASGIVNVVLFQSGTMEFWNCKMPASHTLTTGTAQQFYTVANYGSDDTASLTSADSEQQLEIHTHMGTVDVETTVVRTGGASDGATGAWTYALTANNVTDNFVGVVSPWMRVWVEGDGTAKTLDVYIANDDAESAGNLLQDDEVFLEVGFPSEAGDSMYDYLPDEGAPGDGGGRMQLLDTAANLTTTSETWGAGANNDQKLSQSIAPDYQGWLYCRVHYSKSATPPVLFVDMPEVT